MVTVSRVDVEREIARLFGDPSESGMVIHVHGAGSTISGRNEAFRDLLESLAMYHFPNGESDRQLAVKPPDMSTIADGLCLLATPECKRRLFEHVLFIFGKRIVEPLGEILDTTPGDTLLPRIKGLREQLLGSLQQLRLTQQTQTRLGGDLRGLLTDEYLVELAEHEEKVLRPRVTALAQQILHVIGITFDRAFRNWPTHAQAIAESVSRRLGTSLLLRESPVVIRTRIVEGIEEFLWIETSTELKGAVAQLSDQPQYRGLLTRGLPELGRATYRRFAESCWLLIAEIC